MGVALAVPWWRRSGKKWFASPPIMRSATISKAGGGSRQAAPAAKWSAPFAIHWGLPTMPRSCLQAQASGADIVGIANAGDDTINSMKQAAEFGLTPKQKLVGLILGMNGLPALTLKAAQGA
jgi:hypothetical protein